MFLIIPCGHSFRVKITSFKKWRKVTDVTSATIIKFNTAKLKGNDRLLIKFYSTDSDDGMQRSKWFFNVKLKWISFQQKKVESNNLFLLRNFQNRCHNKIEIRQLSNVAGRYACSRGVIVEYMHVINNYLAFFPRSTINNVTISQIWLTFDSHSKFCFRTISFQILHCHVEDSSKRFYGFCSKCKHMRYRTVSEKSCAKSTIRLYYEFT